MQQTKENKIGVIGLGHIGLPVAAAFAMSNCDVVGLDINQKRVDALNATYEADFFEPGLTENLQRFRNHVEFTANYDYLMKECDVVIVVVGTTIKDDLPNFTDLEQVTNAIGSRLRKGQVIILKSTVFPGVTRDFARKIGSMSGLVPGVDFFVAFCPERAIEGKVIEELLSLPKIIGGINQESLDQAAAIIAKIGGEITKVSSPEVAELCKLLDNAYRVANIAFSNEIGTLCEKMGIDSHEVIRTANKSYDRTNLFLPALGAGGPCLSKDPQILSYFIRQNNLAPRIINACVEVSKESNDRVAQFVCQFVNGQNLAKPRISLMGLAFKGAPETDDIRNSPSADIYAFLKGQLPDAEFKFYDPLVKEFLGFAVSDSMEEVIQGANVVIFLTNHSSLRNIEMEKVVSRGARPLLVIDCWHNIVNADARSPEVAFFRVGDGTK